MSVPNINEREDNYETHVVNVISSSWNTKKLLVILSISLMFSSYTTWRIGPFQTTYYSIILSDCLRFSRLSIYLPTAWRTLSIHLRILDWIKWGKIPTLVIIISILIRDDRNNSKNDKKIFLLKTNQNIWKGISFFYIKLISKGYWRLFQYSVFIGMSPVGNFLLNYSLAQNSCKNPHRWSSERTFYIAFQQSIAQQGV